MVYARLFLLAAAIPLTLVMALGWYVQPVFGDLTRLGRLAERDFGWNAPQPVVDVVARNASVPPVVAVLGDSFSERNIWQTLAMEKTGLPFVSFDWRAMGDPACVGEWTLALKAAYPSVRVVVVQTVERMFIKRFAGAASTCAKLNELRELSFATGQTPATRDLAVALTMPDVAYLWRATLNTRADFTRVVKTGSAYVAPLIRRDMFSSRRPDLLVVYEEDLHKQHWQASEVQRAAQRVLELQAMALARGLHWIPMVVPDKSTVYAPYLKQPLFPTAPVDVWSGLATRQVVQIDVRPAFSSALNEHVDLYLPNDTHVGAHGYALLGDAVARAVRPLVGTDAR